MPSISSPRVLQAALLWVVAVPLATCCSCKRGQADPKMYANAATAYAEAVEFMNNADYENGLAKLNVALAGGGLLPDEYAEAQLARAECNARLGNFQKALADLEQAQRGAAADQIHRYRSFVFTKQGKQAEARSEMSAARSINPRIKPIKD